MSTQEQLPEPDKIRDLAADMRARGYDKLAEWLDEQATETQEATPDD